MLCPRLVATSVRSSWILLVLHLDRRLASPRPADLVPGQASPANRRMTTTANTCFVISMLIPSRGKTMVLSIPTAGGLEPLFYNLPVPPASRPLGSPPGSGYRLPGSPPVLHRWRPGLATTLAPHPFRTGGSPVWQLPRLPTGPAPVAARFGNYRSPRPPRRFSSLAPHRPRAGGSQVWQLQVQDGCGLAEQHLESLSASVKHGSYHT